MAAGQFQTFRYLGSILSTSLLGLLFGGTITSSGLHVLAGTLAGISMLLLVVLHNWRLHFLAGQQIHHVLQQAQRKVSPVEQDLTEQQV